MILVGDQLTTDIAFGKMNNMASIYVYNTWNSCNAVEFMSKYLYEFEKA